ncbi:hypothetical protein MPS_0739 [Mycobacterium pseudoshottsii JCM 15466]|nr:hypothetical protein [Mycobacterium pseudoshottsii]GAQ32359.1 hypothetical protein MPS_0739 [Mycobacterium pseudoshottsii JCM 15466]
MLAGAPAAGVSAPGWVFYLPSPLDGTSGRLSPRDRDLTRGPVGAQGSGVVD